MIVSPREIREHLMASSTEFQQLATQHSQYEAELERLSKSSYLSVEDLIQQSTLKKLKLRVKDEMERLIARQWAPPGPR